MEPSARRIKCVVWDLDNTLWPGIAAEDPVGTTPEPDPRVLAIVDELEKRGIVSSVASRNDPSLGGRLLEQLQLAGKFVAPQIGWEPKSQALRRIADRLNIGVDALAFVDDSPFERAEVAYMLPRVTVLAPEEIENALSGPVFNPGPMTAEGSRRAEMYRAEERRSEAEAVFAGSRTEFLKSCDMHLNVGPAVASDLERIAELVERTHQLNTTGRQYTKQELSERLDDPRWLIPAARLTDRFGDYGLIGAALVDKGGGAPATAWYAELVMLSCRVEGRGIPGALLTWLMHKARREGARTLQAAYRVNEANLPMRLLFRQMGFQPTGQAQDVDLVAVERDLRGPLPEYPEWLHVNEGEDAGG